MERGAPLTIAVGCLLVAAAVLLYLEWWRAGELELLNDRVNTVEGNVRSLAAKRAARRPASTSEASS